MKGSDNDLADFWSREGILALKEDRLPEEQVKRDLADCPSVRHDTIDELLDRFSFVTTRSQKKAQILLSTAENDSSATQVDLTHTSLAEVDLNELTTKESARPDNWKEWVLYAHSFGHYGAYLTTQRLRNVRSWPNMLNDVKSILRKCHVCHMHNHFSSPREPLHLRDTDFVPMQNIEIDHIKGLPRMANGYTCILSVIDKCTRYVMFIPVLSDTAVETALALWTHWFTRFGFPRSINSDRGPAFRSEMFSQFTTICGVSQRFSTPHMPRGHGSIENAHKTMNAQLRKVLAQEYWDIQISLIAYNMNSTVIKHLGFSPMELLFGRNVASPTLDNLKHEDRWQFLSQVILPLAKGRSLKARQVMKKAYDRFHGVQTLGSPAWRSGLCCTIGSWS